jgi:5-methylcytosine-specific restriction protein B
MNNKTKEHIKYIFDTNLDNIDKTKLSQNKGLSALCLLYKSKLSQQEISEKYGDNVQFNNITTASVPEFIKEISKYCDVIINDSYINEENNLPISQSFYDDLDFIHSFIKKTEDAGLIFSPQLIQRFVASLCTKPFVICSGLSGSGKTKLAQAFVHWICENEKQYKIIPVGADWTNREPLLGYPNGLDPKSYVTPDSGALQLIIEASKVENQKKPYFMILDEMNLSHVERYFADFLSIMESKEKLKLYSGDKRYSQHAKENEFNEEYFIPLEIECPKNLFIIGTVNIDETTYMFSPKVLDRANVIEFRITPEEMQKYLRVSGTIDMAKLHQDENKDNSGLGSIYSADFIALTKHDDDKEKDKIRQIELDELNSFFKELQGVGAEFGYRSAAEIRLLIHVLSVNDDLIRNYLKAQNDNKDITDEQIKNHKIDIAIMQKLLPKLHGSRKKLVAPLETLAGFCLKRKEDAPALDEQNKSKTLYQQFISEKSDSNRWEIKYPITFEKIERMLKNVIENGFTSYAEA